MKKLKSLKDQYGTFSETARKFSIHETQLKRLISKGALYNEKGEIFIPSKTKLTFTE